MTNLRANNLIYLGALLTLSHLRREFPMPGFLADVHPAPVWTNAAWRKLYADHNNC